MKQLSGLDSAFLNFESTTQFGHVSGLAVFGRPITPRYDPYAAWKEQLGQRLHLLEPLRRRVVEVPLGLDHPFWIADPDFDLEFHVRHTAVPPPGSDQQLADVVGRIVARPLDRRRPLWLSYVIEGLADNRFAVLTLIHHAAVDGVTGMELMTLMLDENPGGTRFRRRPSRGGPSPCRATSRCSPGLRWACLASRREPCSCPRARPASSGGRHATRR